WRNSVFAVNASAINLFVKPGLYGEMFYDQKSNYSLNCQLVIKSHNILIVDYSLVQLGSIHNVYTFQNTHIAKSHGALIPWGHWTWGDMAYPTEKWCVVPFKKPWGKPKSEAEHIQLICVKGTCV
ncbi:hypothetical protein PAXRUDRAFT_155487, partial [Paxillus rubicundulus Ve08.2h10]